MVVEAMPMPTLEPLDRLTPPARAASFDLSVASMVTFAPVTLPASTLASALEATTLTAPPKEMVESLPATLPARDCAASLPRNSPSIFWVRVEARVTSPPAAMSPAASTFA